VLIEGGDSHIKGGAFHRGSSSPIYISEICLVEQEKEANFNFQKGDPYVKIDEGYARLPGAGYTALHPELEGVDPEDYSDITKMSILGDVAPYSREYNKYRAVVEKQSRGDNELRSRYEQIIDQVRQTKESTLQVDERRFDAPVDQIQGTIKSASFKGIELAEYPGASSISVR
jgi:hypothetical protein